MVLEATMIIIDDSEWSRNGDFLPTRAGCQVDAANLIIQAKTQQNPESTVGVMTLAGAGPRVLVTPSRDLGKLMSSLASISPAGSPNPCAALQIAQLALKHRQNKNQRQRIVMFVASPVAEAAAKLGKLGKSLKKNNVAVDVVSFGEVGENGDAVRSLVDAVQSNDNSHAIEVEDNSRMLSDVLISSPVIMEEGAVASAAGGGGGGAALGDAGLGAGAGGFEFGVDPELDPELALALRISAEEARAREQQESAAGDGGGESGADAMDADGGAAAADAGAAGAAGAAEAAEAADAPTTPATSGPPQTPGAPGGFAASAAMGFDQDDDAALQAALALSVQETQASPSTAQQPQEQQAGAGAGGANPSTPGNSIDASLSDPKYIEQLLSGLSGVSPGQSTVQDVMRGISRRESVGKGKGEGAGSAGNDGDEKKKKDKDEDKMDEDGDDDHLYD